MLQPLRTALPRASASLTRPIRPSSIIHHPQLRRYSSKPSQTGAFYKTFTRPVAKCALLAVLVYQVIYFSWVKLETNEVKEEKNAEMIALEAQVRALDAESRKLEGDGAAAAAIEAPAGGNGDAGAGGKEGKGRGWGWW